MSEDQVSAVGLGLLVLVLLFIPWFVSWLQLHDASEIRDFDARQAAGETGVALAPERSWMVTCGVHTGKPIRRQSKLYAQRVA